MALSSPDRHNASGSASGHRINGDLRWLGDCAPVSSSSKATSQSATSCLAGRSQSSSASWPGRRRPSPA